MELSAFKDARIRISYDEMEAFLFLPALPAGQKYTVKDIVAFLNAGRVVFGIDEARIRKMIDSRAYEREVCVATGIRPVEGQDGFFEYKFNMDLNSKPQENSDGSVDYWSIHTLETVEEGQVIATYHEPVEGSDGKTVTDKVVPCKRARALPPLAGKGFTRSEDNCTYTADLNGKIEMKNGRIMISNIHEVMGDVDLHTGNIDFRGDVLIHGSVTPGAVVKATGSITVDGICENCMLDAGKDIILRGGVLGGHSAVIRSKANIHAQFLEYCSVEAEGFIEFNYALSCNITCYDHIYVAGKKASIVGGSVYATSGVDVAVVGNMNEVKTNIHVGTNTSVLKEIIDLQNQMTEANEMVEKITGGLQQFDIVSKERGIDNRNDERRIALLRTRMTKQAEIATIQKELDRLNVIVERGKEATVKVLRDVYPGTTIGIDQMKLTVKDKQQTIEFRKRKGKVVMVALEDVLVG